MSDSAQPDPDVTVVPAPHSISKLASALAKFQGKMPSVPKKKTATVQTKSGGSYSYQYADLADVTASAMPILSEFGLAFISIPEEGSRGFILRGVLVHESGESVEGFLPIYGGTNQEIGSSLTYSRRYLLGALTGIVTDDDSDGAPSEWAPRTEKVPPRQSQPKQAKPPQGPPPTADPAWSDKITDAATFDDLTAVYNEADRMGVLGHMLGEETVKSRLYVRRSELTSKGAQ